MSDFINTLNAHEVRVYPPRIELHTAEIADMLASVIEGGPAQQYAVASALVAPLNNLIKPLARRIGFMFNDPETKLLTYVDRLTETVGNITTYSWAKGRALPPKTN
ncbi:MAG: hypothetical protein Q7R34_06770 [Dehalococcoidia bacterium]|nr:hypothetical protein [Dehalococcoidia bacterium]